MLCEITTPLIESWLDDKAKTCHVAENEKVMPAPRLSWSARADLRNILSGIFTKAEDWGFWRDRNPVQGVTLGRQAFSREKRKLTEEQQVRILSVLPEDVCLIIETALFCLLRISEVLGLQEKHLDFEAGLIQVRQRFYRGDLDGPKNGKPRDVPMGDLADRLRKRLTGNPGAFVFHVETKPRWGQQRAICRDDRDIQQHFLRPIAKKLGIHWKGFGLPSIRYEYGPTVDNYAVADERIMYRSERWVCHAVRFADGSHRRLLNRASAHVHAALPKHPERPLRQK
jgi:integrase